MEYIHSATKTYKNSFGTLVAETVLTDPVRSYRQIEIRTTRNASGAVESTFREMINGESDQPIRISGSDVERLTTSRIGAIHKQAILDFYSLKI